VPAAGRISSGIPAGVPAAAPVVPVSGFTPDELDKYAPFCKMLKAGVPKPAVQLKVEMSGLDVGKLETICKEEAKEVPTQGPVGVPVAPVGSTQAPATQAQDSALYAAYCKTLKMGVPLGAVKNQMREKSPGLNPDSLPDICAVLVPVEAAPAAPAQGSVGMPVGVPAQGSVGMPVGVPEEGSVGVPAGMPVGVPSQGSVGVPSQGSVGVPAGVPAQGSAAPAGPRVALEYDKYCKMLKTNVPLPAVLQKITRDSLSDKVILDKCVNGEYTGESPPAVVAPTQAEEVPASEEAATAAPAPAAAPAIESTEIPEAWEPYCRARRENTMKPGARAEMANDISRRLNLNQKQKENIIDKIHKQCPLPTTAPVAKVKAKAALPENVQVSSPQVGSSPATKSKIPPNLVPFCNDYKNPNKTVEFVEKQVRSKNIPVTELTKHCPLTPADFKIKELIPVTKKLKDLKQKIEDIEKELIRAAIALEKARTVQKSQIQERIDELTTKLAPLQGKQQELEANKALIEAEVETLKNESVAAVGVTGGAEEEYNPYAFSAFSGGSVYTNESYAPSYVSYAPSYVNYAPQRSYASSYVTHAPSGSYSSNWRDVSRTSSSASRFRSMF
jgi:hypothetical protein